MYLVSLEGSVLKYHLAWESYRPVELSAVEYVTRNQGIQGSAAPDAGKPIPIVNGKSAISQE